MPGYTDMSVYEYAPDTIPGEITAFNVGWLSPNTPFPTGKAPDAFLETLFILCRDHPFMKMRGWKKCPLPHAGDHVEYPATAQAGDRHLFLGGAEIRLVSGDGDWLIAPDLVHHYVSEHAYLPPQPFIEAVMDRRIAPSAY